MQNVGRRPTPDHKKREVCNSIRLQAYWLFWLKKHSKVGGRMIEEALRGYFAPDESQIIKEFYGRSEQ